MRVVLLAFCAGALFAQQPILYSRGAVNAASLAPFGLPNGAIAAGSIFTIFGENLGPAVGQSATAFPLLTALQGVSLSVTQNGVTSPAFPVFVSATQVNAIMPSSVTPGLASLRLFYNGTKSNAIPVSLTVSSPGVFAVSSGGYGPAVVQNFVTATNQPVNSSITPIVPGGTITIWGTGLGPVPYADNIAPTAGNIGSSVSVTVGGQPAALLYAGRSPCCSGVDQIVATLSNDTASGCWVPITIKAGGVVSNTTTVAVAAAGATSCSDPANPLSALVLSPGKQALIHIGRSDKIDYIESGSLNQEVLDKFYSRFFTRPNSPFNFDPFMSLPPVGSCFVHQTTGDVELGAQLRGTLPASASLAQPAQSYSNGTLLKFSPQGADYSTSLGGNIAIGNDAPLATGMDLLGANATYTIDPGGPNQTVFPLSALAPPAWARSNGIPVISRATPLALTFTPADPSAPTEIVIQSYAASANATVVIQCLAAAAANSFTVPADILANLPLSYRIADGSYTVLFVGSFKTVPASSGLATGVLVRSNWVGQTVVTQ